MQSTFSGIEIGKRSLFAHSLALSTVGHNLSNASAEGYSRQRVELEATQPIYRPQLNRAVGAGHIGQGVDAARVSRVRDELLEGRIVANTSGEGYWSARDNYILQLEQIYNEPSELSLRGTMDRFWDGWEELSIYPDQMAARQVVVENGRALVNGMKLRYESLEQIRSMLNDDITATAAEVNDLSAEIAGLNHEIVNSKAAGDEPNDLLDRRDLLIENLGKLIDITVDYRDPDEVNIHTAGFQLIQGGSFKTFSLEADPLNEGFSRIRWAYNGEEASFNSGKLAALFELRDVDIREEIQGLDNMTVNFIDLVNEIHREGYGLSGQTGVAFFNYERFVNNVNGNFDADGDGAFDSSYIFRITGANTLDPQQEIGLAGTITLNGAEGPVNVAYRPEDTVRDLILRMNNSGADVVARLDRGGRLSLKATPSAAFDRPDFVIQQIEDSGQFLVGYSGILLESGAGGAYNFAQPDAVSALRGGALNFEVSPLGHPSAWMSLNDRIRNDPGTVATSFGSQGRSGELGDGRAALEIAGIRNQPVMLGRIPSFDDYFADTVVFVGLKGQEAEIAMKTQELIMKDLRDARASISGVNIDEELAQMIKYQHGYNAASRFINTMNSMLDTIINRLGV
ncbi:MAG: flagellar hook-associated protein FlgK [Salinispira sp.]